MSDHENTGRDGAEQVTGKKPGTFARLMQKLRGSDEDAEEKARLRRMFAERMDKGF